ncbi:MAG: hypothetical protein ACTHMO_08645 [Rhodanobacteraceae bacterium]
MLEGAAGLAAVAFIGVFTGPAEGGFASRGVFGASAFELVVREGVFEAGGFATICAEATPLTISTATKASACRKLITFISREIESLNKLLRSASCAPAVLGMLMY